MWIRTDLGSGSISDTQCLCNLGKVTQLLRTSVFSSVKWGNNIHLSGMWQKFRGTRPVESFSQCTGQSELLAVWMVWTVRDKEGAGKTCSLFL